MTNENNYQLSNRYEHTSLHLTQYRKYLIIYLFIEILSNYVKTAEIRLYDNNNIFRTNIK